MVFKFDLRKFSPSLVEMAFRRINRKMIRDGVIKQLKAGETYSKPSDFRQTKAAEAKKRHMRKEIRRQVRQILWTKDRGL